MELYPSKIIHRKYFDRSFWNPILHAPKRCGSLDNGKRTHTNNSSAPQWEIQPDIVEKRRPQSLFGRAAESRSWDSAAAPCWPCSLAQRLATFLPASHQLICQLSALLARAILISFSRSSLRRWRFFWTNSKSSRDLAADLSRSASTWFRCAIHDRYTSGQTSSGEKGRSPDVPWSVTDILHSACLQGARRTPDPTTMPPPMLARASCVEWPFAPPVSRPCAPCQKIRALLFADRNRDAALCRCNIRCLLAHVGRLFWASNNRVAQLKCNAIIWSRRRRLYMIGVDAYAWPKSLVASARCDNAFPYAQPS